MEYNDSFVLAFRALAAAIAVFTAFGPAIGQGMACAKAVESIGRNPGAGGQIQSTMILGQAIIETNSLYGLFIAIMLIFVFK